MKEKTTQTKKKSMRLSGAFVAAALAAIALFAACQRPEPEPDPPTPPVVNPDTVQPNKFIGTWVLCAMNDVNSEPPATCDLADATTDTLVFVDDTTLIHHHGARINEYFYEFTDNFLVSYRPKPFDIINGQKNSNRYCFRAGNQELVLRGTFPLMGYSKNFCFRRIPQNQESD